MEMKFEAQPDIWQKFQQLSTDVRADPNKVFSDMVQKNGSKVKS
jgi:hypothetical protein